MAWRGLAKLLDTRLLLDLSVIAMLDTHPPLDIIYYRMNVLLIWVGPISKVGIKF